MRNLICKVVFSLLCYNSLFAQAPLFYSEYVEGFSNHKYIEIYNPTDSVVSLSEYAFVYTYQVPNNPGEFDTWKSFDDGATIAPQDVYVIAYPSADEEILSETDQTQVLMYNGNDCVGLVYGTEDDYILLDLIGDMYITPAVAWDVAGYVDATKDHTLIRKHTVEHGNIDWEVSAGTSPEDSEWIVLEQNTWDFVGSHEDISDLYPIGCTDSISINYCEECNLDDGTCEYPELNLSISEIQGMQDVSPYVGQMVSTFGHIKATIETGYFIQTEDSLWSGIFVEDNLNYASSGMSAEIRAKVYEVNGKTVLTDVISYTGIIYTPEGAPSVSPYFVNESLSEKHESCYIEVVGTCVESNDENGEAVIELLNSTSEIKTSDLINEYDFQVDSMYRIKGIVDFSNDEFKLCPIHTGSISPYISIEEVEQLHTSINLINNYLEIETQNKGVQDYVIYNMQGKVVKNGSFENNISIQMSQFRCTVLIVRVGGFTKLIVR